MNRTWSCVRIKDFQDGRGNIKYNERPISCAQAVGTLCELLAGGYMP